MGIGQRFQQHTIEQAEHHRGSACAEGKRQQRDSSESGLLYKAADGITNIVQEIFEPASAPGFAALLFGLLGSAKSDERLTARLVAAVTLRHQILGMLRDVKAQLLVQLRFHFAALEQPLHPVHLASPSASFRTSPTISANCFQLAVSLCS